MKKKQIKGIILLLMILPIAYKLLVFGMDGLGKAKLITEDDRLYEVGDVIENAMFRIRVDRVQVAKTPEDVAGVREYFESHSPTITYNAYQQEDIPIEVSEEGVLENDVSYLKIYVTGESISDKPLETMNFSSALLGGGEPISSTHLFSDKVSGQSVLFNTHDFPRGEEKEVVISFIVRDQDLEQFEDSLLWSVDLPKAPSEQGHLTRRIKLTVERE